jgi:hypothetical protein
MTRWANRGAYSDSDGPSAGFAGRPRPPSEARRGIDGIVFGEVAYMRVDRGRINWGVFFIVLGAVPLAYHQGIVSSSAVGDAWRLWPLILVGIGLGFVLTRTPAHFLGGLVVAASLGLVLGGVFAIGPNFGCGGTGGNATTVSRDGAFDGSSSVSLNLRCGSATITTSSDNRWHVNATNSGGGTTQVSSDANSLTVNSNNGNEWWADQVKDNWQIALPSSGETSLSSTMDLGDAHFNLAGSNVASAAFTLNMGSLHVDLTGAGIGSLNVSTNLGSAWVELGSASDVTGTLRTSLGSLDVCAPADLGVQISATDSLSASDFSAMGMSHSGNVWQTLNYATATHKANLTVNTSLGSLKLHPAGGCK